MFTMINYSFLSFSSSICIYVLFFSSTTFASTSNETDLKALLQFKSQITHDPFQILSSWNHTIHFCQWQGITCGHLRRPRVTEINLQSLNLAGSISPYIGNLTFLKNLYLENNSFSSQIPNQISHLRRLQQLRLNNNSISGQIPCNISSFSNLIFIRLDNNKLEGEIPAEFGSLSKLQALSLFKNKLSGTIPYSLGNLSQLQKLGLDSNEFVGTIPYSLGHLKSLKSLTLFLNRLSGNVPPSIFNLSSLELLDISENHLQGNLPSDIGFSLPKISFFASFSNAFVGQFPSSFSNATNLEVLSLNQNKLTGQVPSLANLNKLNFFTLTTNYLGNGNSDDLSFLLSLKNATKLRILCINDNNLGGTIPRAVGNLSVSLEVFLLDNNQITGNLPSDIGNLGSLQDFEVWNNKLSGFIPDSIGKLQDLGMLVLSNNMFSGKIPFSFGNLTNLIQFDVSQNNLWGDVPPILGKCENLLLLNLSFNKFHGPIPVQILNLSSLAIYLDLSDNNFTGTLPEEVGNLKNLGDFDVSGNKLSGEIPSSLGSCTSMEILNMHGNHFQGSIPSSLSSLKALKVLDLSGNNLSGEIPEFLPLLRDLQYLNLSHNNLEGQVPTKGIFQNASSTSVEGNNMLCGGIPKFHLPQCNSLGHKKNGVTLKLELLISVISVVSGVSFVSVILFLFRVKQKIKKKLSSNLSNKKFLELSYQTLCKATNGFSSENLVGKGYFGSVYKGTLDADATFVAIKVFNLTNRGAFQSFLAECEALRNIRHRNVVKVITACSSIDYEGNDFKALIYEFMVNGSLDEWLHPKSTANEEDKRAKTLNVVQRLSIAIDIAHALDYLHNHCETPIVHCDLKPSNVLLDQHLVAHIGDFGLAKFLPFQSIHLDNESCSIGVRGTVGYSPPEYGMGSEVSTCGDVYSYGVLLLEMFTGKRPTEEMLSLSDMVKLALRNNKVVEMVDPNIVWETGKASRKILLECLISILQIGVVCCAESPRDRMSIGEVIGHLIMVKAKLARIMR